MYHDFEKLIDAFPRLGTSVVPMLSYEATTDESMSGGPVWIYDDDSGRRYLVGIHRGRNLFCNHADAVLVNASVIQQLNLWGVKRGLLSLA